MTFVSTDARNKYEEVIAHNISSRRLFTALDITRIVQDMLKFEGKPVERHRNLKSVLHQLFESNETPCYERILKDVGGADGSAFVYYHYQDDPDTYGQPDTLALPTSAITISLLSAPQAALPAPVIDTTQKSGAWLKGKSGKMLDSKKRIRFPKKVLDAAGFSPGDFVYISMPDGHIAITALPPAGTSSKKYTVDCYGNLRADVSKAFSGTEEFTFSAQNGKATATAV